MAVNVAMVASMELKVLDLLLRNVAYTPGATIYAGLATALSGDGASITEVSGGSYARQPISFAAAASRSCASSSLVTFPEATASWGTVTHVVLYDSLTGGNALFYGALASGVAITTGEQFSIDPGDLTVSMSGGISTTLANAVLDHVLRNQPWTSIPSVKAGLMTAFTNESTFTEVTGGSYARTTATFAAASGGSTSNSATVAFPTATADWGTVTHHGVFNGSTNALMLWSALTASKAVASGKTAKFLAGALVHTLD